MNFTDYAATEGCQLLRDDINFVRQRLNYVPKTQRRAFMLRYVALWLQAMDEEPIQHKKQNRGRYAANSWLVANTCM